MEYTDGYCIRQRVQHPYDVGLFTKKTKIIFLTNPFNPTGDIITKQEFNEFSNKVPEDVLIIVDEAYFEFLPEVFQFVQIALPEL